jgi:tetratricopeptide (TPR) repeat protein
MPPAAPAPAPSDPAKDPNLIRVHDAYGRELFITKEQWRDSVLLGHLKKVWDQPDELAPAIIQALKDGFAPDVVLAARHLAEIDPNPERGHILHAVTLLDLKRYDDAEAALLRFCQQHAETGTVLTNLAKVHSARGDEARSVATLWRGLTLDPNQDNGLGWYEVIHREKDGPAAGLDALRRIATVPGAWRARLWLARDRLEQRDLPAALAFYTEALACAPRPVPTDLLQQMSGDLGNQAHLPEIIQLVAPHFEVAFHGLAVGNNLIKASLDLGQLDTAQSLLDRLYAQQRPDWKHHLAFWDTEIAKFRVDTADLPVPGQLSMTLLSIEGPVWIPPASPAAELFSAKPADAPIIAFMGGTADVAASDGQARLQLADGPGRLSRALPLYLAEQVEFTTPCTTRTLVPWLVKPSCGFVLSGISSTDADAAAHARQVGSGKPADYVVVTHLGCQAEPWTLQLRFIRTIDARCLGELTTTTAATDPGPPVVALASDLRRLLLTETESAPVTPPAYYRPAPVAQSSTYLLRLEQLLAVRTAGMDHARGTLNGEREILDGHLQLCLDQPESVSIRLLFAHTLRGMKKVRHDILPEFRARTDLLHQEKPLAEPARSLVARILAEAFAG